MYTVAIPSRYASTRFPGKALYEIHGVPMVIRVVRQCLKVFNASDVFVVAEDNKVADCVREHGYQVLVDERPATSGTEKIAQLMDQLPGDRIINVQGDEPIVSPQAIENVVLAGDEYPDCVIQACFNSERSDPNSVKMVVDRYGRVLYFSRQPIPTGAKNFLEHVGIFSYNKEQLAAYNTVDRRMRPSGRMPLEEAEDIELLRFIELGVPVMIAGVPPSRPVDSLDDIPFVESVIKSGLCG